MKQVTAIVLAAGKGVRMQSHKPKILHAAAGRTLIEHVLHQLKEAGLQKMRLVIGHGGDLVKAHLKNHPDLEFFEQHQQLGTADAVKSAKPENLSGAVLICNGDHPLITGSDYREDMETFFEQGCDLLVVSAVVKNPTGFGRIVRGKKDNIEEIVEEKDASIAQRKIREVNTGLYVVKSELLKEFLPKIKNNNSKKEFYLTDLISLTLNSGGKLSVHKAKSPRVCRGVNNQTELALASRALYKRKALELLNQGVVIVDPAHTYIDGDVEIGAETIIQPGCMITEDIGYPTPGSLGQYCLHNIKTACVCIELPEHVEREKAWELVGSSLLEIAQNGP